MKRRHTEEKTIRRVVARLIGVIVSHVIVLFDFMEEMHEKREPFEQSNARRGYRAVASR